MANTCASKDSAPIDFEAICQPAYDISTFSTPRAALFVFPGPLQRLVKGR